MKRKKRQLVILGLGLLLAAVMAGCGKKETNPVGDASGETPTPAPTATPIPSAEGDDDLVEMQVTVNDDIKNAVGEQTSTSVSTVVTNRTGSEIGEFYVRVHPEDDDEEEWGGDLIGSTFSVPDGEKFLYYHEKTNQDQASPLYDLRICYTEEGRSECYFRNIPIETITEIVLRMDGSGEDSIPYATYITSTNNSEYSTLTDVKRRLGLLEEEEEPSQSDIEPEPTQAPVQIQDTATPTPIPDNPTDTVVDPGIIDGDSNAETSDMATARSFVGQSLDSMEESLGSPNGSDYEEEPELGRTGYHYYGSFTVSTSVDDNGNETVTGVW